MSLNTGQLFEARKKCSRCQQMLASSCFYRDSNRRSSWCRACWKTFNANPARVQRRSDLRRQRNAALRLQVLKHYSAGTFNCACCPIGTSHPTEFLCLDHINGGGGKHRAEVGLAISYWNWFVTNGYPAGFRVLCHNCNMARGSYGMCPHDSVVAHAS